jgi:hypothetical protein
MGCNKSVYSLTSVPNISSIMHALSSRRHASDPSERSIVRKKIKSKWHKQAKNNKYLDYGDGKVKYYNLNGALAVDILRDHISQVREGKISKEKTYTYHYQWHPSPSWHPSLSSQPGVCVCHPCQQHWFPLYQWQYHPCCKHK